MHLDEDEGQRQWRGRWPGPLVRGCQRARGPVDVPHYEVAVRRQLLARFLRHGERAHPINTCPCRSACSLR